jgi:hypothetical protein
MNTVDWLRSFKNHLILKLNERTNWTRVEISAEIIDAYNKTLEAMINPVNDGREEKD